MSVELGPLRERLWHSRKGFHKKYLVLLALMLASASSARSETSTEPQASVFPKSVELLSDRRPTDVLVVLHNASGNQLHDVTLSWLSKGGVSISSAAALHLSSVAGHEDKAWLFAFSQPGRDSVAGSVVLRIDYSQESVPKVITQAVAVKSREPTPIDSYLTVKVETTLGTLDRYHPGKVYLLLTNKIGQLITLKIKTSGPDFIVFTSDHSNCEKKDDPKGDQSSRYLPSKAERCGIELLAYQTHTEVFEVARRSE